ncbi:HelD family protein [Rothia sp. P6271]|uniref:HelD family protein n=1 Tax=unclassified Rothia (in: high G+C Gram-positive bacteria) TaxID=2689056 RepID=UPI003AC4D496
MTENLNEPSTSTAQQRNDETYTRALNLERAYVKKLYQRLDEMRAETEQKISDVHLNQEAGNHQNRSERDAYARHYEERLAQLNAVDHRLAFGRLDFDDDKTHYIGRIGIASADYQRLLTDWRAPEAGTFYQATAFDRNGVRRRRHLTLERREVTAIEDDILDASLLEDESALHGEGALLAALNRKRTGRMGDIVATIQSEQDRIIRADLPGVRVVQGGPGTGKTAVALHRAAYLLYTFRERLNNAGVLVIGPSASFMWYIDRVLPSLGETGVVMSSLATLFPGVRAVAEKDLKIHQLKGDLRMVEVIKRAVRDRQKTLEKTEFLKVGSNQLKLTPRMVRSARDRARSTGKPHNEARETFVKILIRELTQQLQEQLDSSSGQSLERPYLEEDIRSSMDVRKALNLAWMPLSAETLVRSLFAKPHYRDSALSEFTADERQLLARSWDAPLTEADVPLLDEAAELLGDFEKVVGASAAARARLEHLSNLENAKKTLENVHAQLSDYGVEGVITAEQLADSYAVAPERMSAAQAAYADRTWAYGHIVVDEAQELTPMQWRVLFRRCPMKSMTIVGDIAQASSAESASSWEQALEPFVGDRMTLETLTVNYRTPAQIAQAAVAVAQAAGRQVDAPRAVRQGQWAPILHRVSSESLCQKVLECITAEVDNGGGLIGVIVTDEHYAQVVQAVAEQHRERLGTSMTALERQILVLTPWESKGLEFDVVIVVEPQAVIRASHGAIGDLYVAMTRPTQRLYMVGAEEFPAGLE